ncbi:MAG TPA: hypothetical protein VJ891_20830, partial [Casimicrobiaceae bacterium]|nr:hypothetical protein [Casimicrobiaceae bacterium]
MTTMTIERMTSPSRWASARHVTLVPLILLVVWQIWAMTLSTNPQAAAPTRVVTTFVDLVAHGGLVFATLQSLGRVVLGFA